MRLLGLKKGRIGKAKLANVIILEYNEDEKYLLNKVVIFHPWFCFNFMCHREGNTRQVFLGDNLQKLHEKDIELHHILLASIHAGRQQKKRK